MQRRDIWRSVIGFVNKEFNLKDNPTRKLNSIEDCKKNLKNIIINIILNQDEQIKEKIINETNRNTKLLQGLEQEVDYVKFINDRLNENIDELGDKNKALRKEVKYWQVLFFATTIINLGILGWLSWGL